MLLKIERKILYTVSKYPEECDLSIEQFKGYSGFDINKAMHSLQEKGYLSEVSAATNYEAFYCEKTTQGKYYKEYLARCFIHDILVPAFVSIITALITLFLTK